MATRDEVKALLAIIAAAYGDKFRLAPKTLDVYADLLADVPIDLLKTATRQHIADKDWPPTVAELRRLTRQLDGPTLPDADMAWSEVIRAIGAVGHTGTPTFSHATIAEAVRGMGGWQLMCAMEIGDTATHRAQFRDVFNAVKARYTRGDTYLPDVRALAVERGALPTPVEAAPALPAPVAPTVTAPPPPIVYADFRRYRAEQVAEREALGRAALARWQAEQEANNAAM